MNLIARELHEHNALLLAWIFAGMLPGFGAAVGLNDDFACFRLAGCKLVVWVFWFAAIAVQAASAHVHHTMLQGRQMKRRQPLV